MPPVVRVQEVDEQVGGGEGLLVPLLELLSYFLLVGELLPQSLPHNHGACNRAAVPLQPVKATAISFSLPKS